LLNEDITLNPDEVLVEQDRFAGFKGFEQLGPINIFLGIAMAGGHGFDLEAVIRIKENQFAGGMVRMKLSKIAATAFMVIIQ